MLRADLHVHSDASGLKQLPFLRMRDCYSPPVEVYRRAKARGMDLVTLTDHDTIDGCLEVRDALDDPPDFFFSEEVETFLPGDRSMHIGVFGITETQHREIQRVRRRFDDLVAYLEQERITASLNHLFRGWRPGMEVAPYLAPLIERFELFETRNGIQTQAYREATERAIELFGRRLRDGRPIDGIEQGSNNGSFDSPEFAGQTAGSDAHTLRRVAKTWTECPGADRDSFLENLARGFGQGAGEDGRVLPLARDVYAVINAYYGSLLGRGRIVFPVAQRWPGALFAIATFPSHLIALPLVASLYNLSVKRARIAWFASRLPVEVGARGRSEAGSWAALPTAARGYSRPYEDADPELAHETERGPAVLAAAEPELDLNPG